MWMLAVTWGFSSICPRISPPGSRRVWKLMYDWPARMFGNWAARVVLLPSARSHLLTIVPPTPLANGVTTTSLGLVSLNGRPKKPKRTPAFDPARGRGVDVRIQQVVARVGGLRACKIEAGDSDGERQGRHRAVQEERRVALGRRGVRRHFLGALEPRHEHVPDLGEGVVGRGGAVVVEAEDDAGEVGVVRLRPAEVVVVKTRPAGTVEKVLHPAAPPRIADEDVQLAVRPELDHSAVVVAAPRRGRRLGGEGRLQRPQPDDVPVERQRRAVPHEPVHPVAQ